MIDVQEYLKSGYYVGNVSELTMDLTYFTDQVKQMRAIVAGSNMTWALIQSVLHHPEYNFSTPSSDATARKQLIIDSGYTVTQQWSLLENKIDTNYFDNLLYEFGYKIYPQLTPECTYGFVQITSYKAGDLIEYHTDGQNPGRFFAGLIYLSDPYENGGGEIDIWETPYTIQDPDITVSPHYGTFVLIDFTKNNPGHAVRIVKDNFHRLCYLNFVSNAP